MITKCWSELGFWVYSCGCNQYQDGYDLCPKHEQGGYTHLIAEFNRDNAIKSLGETMSAVQHVIDNDREKKRMRTMTKRFYVGSARVVNDEFYLTTLGEAIERAKAKATKEGLDEVYVVEVVRIVRRAELPFVVEETR